MKSKKNIISTMLLTLTVLLSVLVLPVAAETVSVGSATVSPGGTATVAVQVTGLTTGIGAATLRLTFNPAVVTVSSVAAAGDLGAPITNINNVAGTVDISAFSATPATTAPVTIATVTLQGVATAAQGATSPLTLTVSALVDSTGLINRLTTPAAATITSGTATISAAPTTIPRIWDETKAPAVPYTWSVYNFEGFFYDLKDDLGKEQLTVLQPNLAAGQRTIDKDRLLYSTQADAKQLKVVSEAFAGSAAAAALKGLERTGAGQAFANGNYDIVGWQADRYIAVNGKIDKLAKLLFEHGTSAAEKKTLTIGDTWDLGGGWTLQAQAIDAKATPRQAWLVLSKDGVKKDDKVISEKTIYTYVEKSLAGETDVPLFLTYVDSVFAGATTDMVQLRYTWVIDPAVTTVKGGDKFGIFEVVTLDTTGKRLVLNNTDSTVSLSQDATVDIMGNIKFKVADKAGVLRFYPKVDYQIGPSVTPTPGPGTPVATVVGTIRPTTNVTVTTPSMTETTAAAAATTAAAAATTKKTEPGFEAIFAIAGLLAVAFLVLRQRK